MVNSYDDDSSVLHLAVFRVSFVSFSADDQKVE